MATVSGKVDRASWTCQEGGVCDSRPARTGGAADVLVESGGDPVRGAGGALVGDTQLTRAGFIGR